MNVLKKFFLAVFVLPTGFCGTALNNYMIPVADDILLIVNYQHAEWYKTIGFLKELYSPYFSEMIFFGPESFSDVVTYSKYNGWKFEYTSIAHVLENFPHYRGYLWINDDLIISPWRFCDRNKENIWLSKTMEVVSLDQGADAVKHWMWWRTEIGYNALQKVINALDSTHLEMLQKNIGVNHGIYGYSDIVYIPTRYREDFINVAHVCAQYNLFLEIALPFICACISPREEWELMNGLDLWSPKDRSNATSVYNESLDFVHPIKISKPENQEKIKAVFEKLK